MPSWKCQNSSNCQEASPRLVSPSVCPHNVRRATLRRGGGERARSCPRECHRDQWWIAGQRRNLGDSPVGTDFPSSLLLPYAPPFSVPKERRLRLFWTMVKGKAFMPPDLKLSWDLGLGAPWVSLSGRNELPGKSSRDFCLVV